MVLDVPSAELDQMGSGETGKVRFTAQGFGRPEFAMISSTSVLLVKMTNWSSLPRMTTASTSCHCRRVKEAARSSTSPLPSYGEIRSQSPGSATSPRNGGIQAIWNRFKIVVLAYSLIKEKKYK